MHVTTTCPYCGVGCGVIATVDADGAVTIKGDPAHPANHGRLCSKGSALAETLDLDGRLLHPEINGQLTDWGRALDAAAAGLARIIEQHGPEAVACYVSGQLLTEDYYVANKLMKGFIGTANIDTNSRLCMASSVAGHKRAFGADAVPCSYEDLERAKLIVLVGSNAAWCHPVLYQRIVRARTDNPDLLMVNIDPRRTATSAGADLHLALKPGSDALLFNGLLVYLEQQGERHPLFTAQHTDGIETALAAARQSAPDIATVAAGCGLGVEEVERFYRLYARTERVVTVYSQGINQSTSGSDKVNALLNCHLLTGRIGRPGMGPFSFTGQPNAMGGREVGGLANQLAAHMAIEDAAARQRVQRFWNAPTIATRPGLKAVELFRAIEAGTVKAVWIMGTNPAVSLPEAERFRAALARCELVIVSDCVRDTDTTRLAHIRLPALAWGEKDGTVTNSERRISRQRAFLPAPGTARPDWWIVSEVARRLGHGAAFPYESPEAIFREHARLSGLDNGGTRPFDISALADLDRAAYDALQPIQWPVTARQPRGTARLFTDGRFATPDGRARFVAVTPRPPVATPDADYPFTLNTGRLRDQWHTMTRTGMAPRLANHDPEPAVEIHPDDARRHGLRDGALAQVQSPLGSVVLRVRESTDQQRGSLFVPIHWNDRFSARARVGTLIPGHTDPVSGQPEAKHAVARIAPLACAWEGLLLSRRRLDLPGCDYWSVSRGDGLWRYRLAGVQAPADWAVAARAVLCSPHQDVGWIELFDGTAGRYRAARLEGGRLESCLFVGPVLDTAAQGWLEQLFMEEDLGDAERHSLLAGRPPAGTTDPGRIVCACAGVGENTLRDAIAGGLRSVEALGKTLGAGTGCGGCLPEVKALLAGQ